jgi:hypothetical protein
MANTISDVRKELKRLTKEVERLKVMVAPPLFEYKVLGKGKDGLLILGKPIRRR